MSSAPHPITSHLTIAEVCSNLHQLLMSEVDSAKREAIDRHGVLSMFIEFAPGLAENMATRLYVDQSLCPEVLRPAPLLPSGWDTTLHIIGNDCRRNGAPDLPAFGSYNDGAQWAVSEVIKNCRSIGSDDGEEPPHSRIARVAEQLHRLLEQVERPADDMPGGASLAVVKFGIAALARNMNAGLYNHFELLPPIANPGYIPANGWDCQLAAIKDEARAKYPDDTDDRQYYYNEGVRWSCASFSAAFRNFSGF